MLDDEYIPEGILRDAATQANPTSIADLIPIYMPCGLLCQAKRLQESVMVIKLVSQMAYYLQDKMEWEGMIVNADYGLICGIWVKIIM